MTRVRVGVRPYRTPFARPIATARGVWREREGAWAAVADESGRVGLGEFTPLPAWGTESFEDGWATLSQLSEGPLSLAPADWGLSPSAAWAALEAALLDLEAQRLGKPLSALFGGSRVASVPVNALLTGTSPEEAVHEAVSAVSAGFRALKLKIGGLPASIDVARVKAVREAVGPNIALRLDANGGWSREEAIALLTALAPFAPDYVEQPVALGDRAGLVEVARRSGVAIAADESACSLEAAKACLEAGVAVLVLKPAALGGLTATRTVVEMARAQGARVVLTSMLDRGVGTAGALHLASASGLEEPHGFATVGHFETPAVSGLAIVEGRVAVPSVPGLGMTPLAPELLSLIEEVRDGVLVDG